ncbi:2OG-Fe(II) oxygenase [bacterium]|nr:2OG-Fe(II) oxygenase [Candidatus Elulimicrobium humile]
MKIIDNFLKKDEYFQILDILTSPQFDWHFNDTVSYSDKPNNSVNDFQFSHIFYKNPNMTSQYFSVLSPILHNLNCDVLMRAKANLRSPTHIIEEAEMHLDVSYSSMINKLDVMQALKTAIYYVNTNDGYTFFEDGTKVESIANRIVIFPSTMRHAGSTHTNAKYRIVLNFNYF